MTSAFHLAQVPECGDQILLPLPCTLHPARCTLHQVVRGSSTACEQSTVYDTLMTVAASLTTVIVSAILKSLAKYFTLKQGIDSSTEEAATLFQRISDIFL